MQLMVITDLATGRNTLRIHLCIKQLIENPVFRKCAAQDERSAHVLCNCSSGHTYHHHQHLGPEDVINLSLGATLNFNKGAGLPRFKFWLEGYKRPAIKT
jgi:hypothetical protein